MRSGRPRCAFGAAVAACRDPRNHKYTPAGGTVTVSTGEREGRPYLQVEDTGPGIPESEREHVRQRFYRMPNSPGHGSGLGLAIVAEIAALYGATLTFEAPPSGIGTRALLRFP